MLKKVLLTVAALLSMLVVLALAAILFREDLVRYGAGRVLAGNQITLSRLQGLEFGASRAAVDDIELLLDASGLRLVITDLDVSYSFPTGLGVPVVDALTIGSARLLSEASADTISGARNEGGTGTDGDTLLLSDVLQLLREFPLRKITITELALPQRQDTLAVEVERSPGVLDLHADNAVLQLRARFTQADADAAARLQASLTRAGAAVGDIDVTLQPADAAFDLTGSGHLAFDDVNALLGELQQQAVALPLKAATLDWDLAGTVADDVSGLSRPASFVLGIQSGSNVVLAGLAEGLGETAVSFSERAELTIATGAGAGISAGTLPVRVNGQWQEKPFGIDTRLSVDDCRLSADAMCRIGFNGGATFADYSLAGVIDVAAPDFGSGALTSAYHVRTEGLTLGGLPMLLPAFDIDAALSVADDTLTFNTPLLLRNAPAATGLTLDGGHGFATQEGAARITLSEVELMEGERPLSAWFSEWPYAFDLLAGTLAGEADVIWITGPDTPTMRGNVSATLNELGGFYNEMFFRGLSMDLQAHVDTASLYLFNTPPLSLSIATIDVGVPLENVKVDFRVERDFARQVLVDSAYAEVLGGTVTGEDLHYVFGRERNDILVRFAGLRIERMLDQIEYKGVEATGGVSGELPITLTPNGVEVAAGMLQADTPGGSIRYVAGALAPASGNPAMDMVNRALGNYQFQSLTSGIEYKPDGELVLAMQLQGHNPDFQNGQRINLNLNLSDDIPALLESLQAARKIEDFLAEQYQ